MSTTDADDEGAATPKAPRQAKRGPKAIRKDGALSKQSRQGTPLYSTAMTSRILYRLMGGESIKAMTRDPSMPSSATIYKWLHEYPDFAAAYKIARQAQAEHFAEEVVEIADELPVYRDAQGNVILDKEGKPTFDINLLKHNEIKIKARQWAAAAYNRKRYGQVKEVSENTEDVVTIEQTSSARLMEIINTLEQSKRGDGE